ncbi:MAG TPA: prenyltransferase/squalene oxidase repeat-containing protein [Terriglobia bacterium]|nr:prenyltransferase/squalene oxidase repeat-containing protein [Terriglobia bacterium]
MSGPLKANGKEGVNSLATPFSRDFCTSFIAAGQNHDGGWGYLPGGTSSVEATSWALVALGVEPNSCFFAEVIRRGIRWMEQAQLPDGSWPAFVGQQEGCWVTSVACIALQAQGESPDRVARGLRWLCDDRPGEARFWWRARRRLSPLHTAVHQNASLYGWSWTRGTASWVEPTACSLLLLRSASRTALPPNAERRRSFAERMLYDRICSGGGWNSGNPLVYRVSGEPRVGPTAWALLALTHYADRPANQISLNWLEKNCSSIKGPGSLALAQICLKAYNRPLHNFVPSIEALHEQNGFLKSVLVFCWVALALSARVDWSQPATGHGN